MLISDPTHATEGGGRRLAEGGAYQVDVPRLSRVAFQSLLPQVLHQQRNHSMVVAAGERRGGRRSRGGGRDGGWGRTWGGDGE